MISEQLYELAFRYKKTKLWNIIRDTEIFAVTLSGDRIGYISIMGGSGGHYALALYIGNEDFQGLYSIATVNPIFLTEYKFHEHILQQNCLQCLFEGKDDLTEDIREEVKAYARANKIKLAGKNPYPHFLKFQANCMPWHLQTEQEQNDLCEAFSAAIALSELLDKKKPHMLGFSNLNEKTTEIPLLKKTDDGYTLQKMNIPSIMPVIHPEPKPENDILVQKLKKQKKKCKLECRIIRFPKPVQDSEEEIPAFPVTLLALNAVKDFLFPVMSVLNYEENAEELLNSFMNALLEAGFCPSEIKVSDKRTYALLKAFCECLHIKLIFKENLPALDEVSYEFWYSFSEVMDPEPEAVLEALHMLMEMDEEELKALPPELQQQFKMLMQNPNFIDEMHELFDDSPDMPVKKISKETASAKQSYIISVSLGTGCYRHIRISCENTLQQLHSAIIDAFEFLDDHAHAFFMDNKKWSDWDSYYMREVADGGRTTDKYRLNQVGLDIGMPFKYVFDFGDEWTFQCKVLRILNEPTKIPTVIKSKGAAPEQYGYW